MIDAGPPVGGLPPVGGVPHVGGVLPGRGVLPKGSAQEPTSKGQEALDVFKLVSVLLQCFVIGLALALIINTRNKAEQLSPKFTLTFIIIQQNPTNYITLKQNRNKLENRNLSAKNSAAMAATKKLPRDTAQGKPARRLQGNGDGCFIETTKTSGDAPGRRPMSCERPNDKRNLT